MYRIDIKCDNPYLQIWDQV